MLREGNGGHSGRRAAHQRHQWNSDVQGQSFAVWRRQRKDGDAVKPITRGGGDRLGASPVSGKRGARKETHGTENAPRRGRRAPRSRVRRGR